MICGGRPWAAVGKYMLYTGILAVGLYAFLAVAVKIWRGYGYTSCMLDGMYRLAVPDVFGFWYLPLTLILMESGRKGHQSAAMMVQYRSLDTIWKSFFVQRCWKSLICSVLYSGICCVISGLSAVEVSNWHLKNSIFYQETKLLYEGTAFRVILLFFFTNFIRTLGVQIMMLLGDINYRRRIIFLILLSAVVISEWMFPELSLYFNLFSITCRNFIWSGKTYVLVSAGLLLMWILYAAGKVQWKKREFYE